MPLIRVQSVAPGGESELAKRGLQSVTPEEAYTTHKFKWDYGGAEAE